MRILSPRTALIVGVVAFVGVLALTFAMEPFRNYQIAIMAAYLCGVAGLTMLTGVSGQLSLGHAAFMACGAYTYGLTANSLAEAEVTGIPLLVLPLIAALITSTLLGTIIGIAGARLHGPYLAGVTLALVVTVPAVTSRFSSVLGGDQGLWISVARRPDFLSGRGATEMFSAWVAVIVAGIVVLLLRNLLVGNLGRRMRAVRDNEVAAAIAGIDVGRTKVVAFTVSAGAAGIGGGLMAFINQTANPGTYSVVLSLFLLMGAVIGGIGTLPGAVWGSILIVLLPDLVSRLTKGLELSTELAQRLDGNLAIALFGIVVILVVIVAPFGLQGLLRTAWFSIRARVTRRQAVATP